MVGASKEDSRKRRGRQAHRKLTGLGIASGSILCLDFCTAGMSDACFTFKFVQQNLQNKQIERVER